MDNKSQASISPTGGKSSRDAGKKCDTDHYSIYKMKRKCVFIVLAIVLLLEVDCQYVQSPCLDIFSYRNDGNSVYGYIVLKSSGGFLSTVHLRANFTVAARLSTTYIGQIETIDNGNQLLQKFNRGVPLEYRVHFPVTSPLPRLTSIVVNGNTLCYGPGDVPGPLQYVTTLSLDHMLFLKGGPNTQIYDPYKIPQADHFVGHEQPGENTQIFTINDIGNRDGSWSSAFPIDPYLILNQTRPEHEQPVTHPVYDQPAVKPTRPRPNPPQSDQFSPDYNVYFPDQTTRPPPPALVAEVLPSIPTRLPAATSVECGVIAEGNERVPLIFNGNTYPRGDWPWLVAVYKRHKGSLTFICSGTLVSERHVVTAAHCMQQKSKLTTIKDIVVKVGVYNLEDWGDDISVTSALQSARIHESYNATTLENDVLVFTMEKTVEFNNYIRPACLWNGNTDLSLIVGASGVVAGWGQTEVGPVGRGEPRMIRIPVVSTSACRASKPEFHKLTSSKTLCAGDRNGSGPCLGDSGGGLYILDNGRWRLRGVVSLSLRPSDGDSTCNLNEYIVFTDTAQYLRWIQKIMSQNIYD